MEPDKDVLDWDTGAGGAAKDCTKEAEFMT